MPRVTIEVCALCYQRRCDGGLWTTLTRVESCYTVSVFDMTDIPLSEAKECKVGDILTVSRVRGYPIAPMFWRKTEN